MQIYKAPSLIEAVEMATRFQQQGRYDWFRGQRKNWAPVPSIVRVPANELKVARKRLERFVLWLLSTPGLEMLKRDPTDAFAIAQHYGLPTPFLDFTTNPGVAGYFASAKRPCAKDTACIHCLNSEDLLTVWTGLRKILPHYPELSLVKVDVPNLWRLEAQQGVFVECLTNWTAAYPLDRIEFPASAHPSFPTEDQIYPTRKSQLEMLLEHHLEAEAVTKFGEYVMQAFPDAEVTKVEGPTEGYWPEFFTKGRLPLLLDWSKTRLKPWLAVPVERFRKTTRGEMRLNLSMKMATTELRAAAAYGVRRALDTDRTLRAHAVRWTIEGGIPPALALALEKLWNGLRLLPYTNDQIASAAGLCFQLYRAGYLKARDHAARRTIAEGCLGPVLRVEFSSGEGNSTRAYVASETLRAAVRVDLKKYLRPEHHLDAEQVQALLQMCMNHRRLFRFSPFADLFVRQIVPFQVLRAATLACHFSPARLEGFGLP